MKKISAAIFILLCFLPAMARAEFVYLKNGDRVSGDVLEKTDAYVKLKTENLGELVIDQKFIDHVDNSSTAPPAVTAAPVPPPPKRWDHKISAGYQISNGNTKSSHANVMTDSHYAKDYNEWIIKSNFEYGSDHGKMNVQKYFAKVQSNDRLVNRPRWFYTRTIEADHDRFANIDYRLLPSVGMGYWFREGDDSKAEADTSVGWEYTNYGNETKSLSSPALVPHLYFDKRLIGKLKFSEDYTFYPSLANFSNYRMRSESDLINPISDKLSWKLSFIDEYNSNPMENFKKNDLTFLTSLEFAF